MDRKDKQKDSKKGKKYLIMVQNLNLKFVFLIIVSGMKEYKCVLCSTNFSGYGNNPLPLAYEGRCCCDQCNITKVVPARLEKMQERKQQEKEK